MPAASSALRGFFSRLRRNAGSRIAFAWMCPFLPNAERATPTSPVKGMAEVISPDAPWRKLKQQRHRIEAGFPEGGHLPAGPDRRVVQPARCEPRPEVPESRDEHADHRERCFGAG